MEWFNLKKPGLFGQLNNRGGGGWYPIEVAEVEIEVSGGRRSGQGPGKIRFDKKSSIFELHKRFILQKKAEKNRFSELKSNIRLFIEKWGKKTFSQFSFIKI
jgi:hypothetical protein